MFLPVFSINSSLTLTVVNIPSQQTVTGSFETFSLFAALKSYMNKFISKKLPEPESQSEASVQEAEEIYHFYFDHSLY